MFVSTGKVSNLRPQTQAILSFRGVGKHFSDRNGQVHAVQGVDLDIYPGEIFGLIGYSGAGKSTLLRMANLLTEPSEGQVIFRDHSLQDLPPKALLKERQSIGMIFQDFNLFSQKSVLDNVAYPLLLAGVRQKEARQRASELLELVGLQAKEQARPASLSGGQKQRVAIARAIANEPKLLLSDEATSALDPQSSKEVLDLLVQLRDRLGLTILLVTHQMEVARAVCDRVAFMRDGAIIEIASARDFFLRPQSADASSFISPYAQEA